jgi:hypothetical protein
VTPYVLRRSTDEWALKAIVADAKKRKLHDLLRQIPADLEAINSATTSDSQACHIENFSKSNFFDADCDNKYMNAGIIFCPHAKGSFGVKNNARGTQSGVSTYLLQEDGASLKIGTFVGGDKPSGDMTEFNKNNQNLMVATKAFGMGIDKPNIRFTINLNHPSSIESFVQEAGRAGRDKKNAISYVLYDPTEYIELTIDKIADIREACIKAGYEDPMWLESYRFRFVLKSEFLLFCKSCGNCSEEMAENILTICTDKGYIENVDKDIVLWFHNNSFRGVFKEKLMLLEMTDHILNVCPRYIQQVQGLLADETGNTDVLLKIDSAKNAIKIQSQEDQTKQYGYIFLDTLRPMYNYIHFDYTVCSKISNALIEILKNYEDHSARALLRPLDGKDDASEGIYSALSRVDKDGYSYVTVSWENQVQQDFESFEQSIKAEISRIASEQGWQDINEDRNGKLNLAKISSFEDLLNKISRCSNDPVWLRHSNGSVYNRLKQLFLRKRDKDDTDKAIYRMCCIGLVEDVTIDYLSETYELKIRNRDDDGFREQMLNFFLKYYSKEQASKRVAQIDQQRGRNYRDKCLGYLTSFVYENLEQKRYRAIEDMRIACEESIKECAEHHDDEWLKTFIHLYFNSKYARRGYQVEIDGVKQNYSLSTETEANEEAFEIVEKYIKVISKDASGSEVDNVKHLYGATLLCLRAHPENAALKLLLTYCIVFLGPGSNETLKANAINGYVEGFMSMYEKYKNDIWERIATYNSYLSNQIGEKDEFFRKQLIDNGMEVVQLLIHEKSFDAFTSNYIKDL